MDWFFTKMMAACMFLGDVLAGWFPVCADGIRVIAWLIPVLFHAWLLRLLYLGFRFELGLIKPKPAPVADDRAPVLMPNGKLMYLAHDPWGELTGEYIGPKPKPKPKLELIEEPKSVPVETVKQRPKFRIAGQLEED